MASATTADGGSGAAGAAAAAGGGHARNPGCELDLGWIEQVRINRPAVLRRAETHLKRRSIKKAAQLAWLLRVVTVIDLTTLAGDDTKSNVSRLCAKALSPVRADLLEKLGVADLGVTVGAVCVYPSRVKDAVEALGGRLPVASVATGFPAGQTHHSIKLAEIKLAVADGATEIDIVIPREHVIAQRWADLYREVREMREACGDAHMKSILAVGELPTFADVYKASLVCMMAGSDFIKTSTGKEPLNATLPVGFVMVRAIREFHERTGYKVGFKPAGGIRSAKDAMYWLSMMYEELGAEWCKPDLFRIGASSLLLDVERQLDHGLTSNYSAFHYLAMS